MTGLQIALTSACVANDPIMRRAWRDLEPYATRKRRYQWRQDKKDEVEMGRREAVAEIIVVNGMLFPSFISTHPVPSLF